MKKKEKRMILIKYADDGMEMKSERKIGTKDELFEAIYTFDEQLKSLGVKAFVVRIEPWQGNFVITFKNLNTLVEEMWTDGE